MKTVILGGVAAGTKTAAKLKRENPAVETVLYTKSEDISYAGCGLPYYAGGKIENKEELIVNSPEKFSALTGVTVHTSSEAQKIDPENKTVIINGEKISYDKLVIATGAEPFIPDVPGTELKGVFTVRTPGDAVNIREYMKNAKTAVVAGGGFIGLEMAENLSSAGLSVTVIDMAPTILAGLFDSDTAGYIKRKLQEKGIKIFTGTALSGIEGRDKAEAVITTAGKIPADMVILALGIRPATAFTEGSGIIKDRGLIVTDGYMRTNIKDIYAAGDCAQVKNLITGKKQWSAMGSTANISGRALGLTLGGEETFYKGTLGTGIIKLYEGLSAARTGLTYKAAEDAGYDAVSVLTVNPDKPHYYPDADIFVIKLIADRKSGKLLGAQIIGAGAVDKICDIAVTGISAGLEVSAFINMDFSYAPPFSTAINPFAAACGVLMNKLSGRLISITPTEYEEGRAAGYTITDAHPEAHFPGAARFDFDNPGEFYKKHKKDEKLLLICARGKRAYITQNKLMAAGYTNTLVLEGGTSFNNVKYTVPEGEKLPASEIKRVKGLGCLQDKRYNDVFNVRVITGNGRLSVEEHRAIAEAAEKFGSGKIAMTSRLTMEIQGVKYNNIDALIEFLGSYGLETGGTGSLVRPVVSCKGTTCQYGLIDTFSLSEKIHERFYKGYHSVTLPHKFKIAVGGCPNNCVKPDLNDLGIIGQRVPQFDMEKCRGCRVCQVEKSCPIKIASLKDGKLSVDASACNGCGRCKNKCPFGVTESYVNGYKVYIGGRWGKKMANGRPLSKIFTSEEEVLDVVERAILFFRNEGITGERFADTVNRLGFSYVEEKLLNSDINKEEILEKKVKGGATC